MNYTEFVKPEIAVIIPILTALGLLLKTSVLPDRKIPLVLGGTGILLAALWVFNSVELLSINDWVGAAFTSISQGVLCAAIAVYGHQVIKQAKKDE